MQRSIVTIDNKKYSNFVCSTYKKYGKSLCTSHLISEEVISNILLTSLNTIIKTVLDVDKALNAKRIISKEKDVKSTNIEISILNSKQVELRKLKTEAYTDLKLEMISNDEYTDIVNSYNNQINIIDNKIKRKYEQIDSINNSHLNTDLFYHFNKYKSITELTRSMVCDLVESITVDAERNIIINFKFADELKEYYLYDK